MDERRIGELAVEAGRWLTQRGLRIALAESCTGGWIAKALTDVPGSSGWFECGWTCYSDQAKVGQLGVSPAILKTHGAVSEETVRAMAEGARTRAAVDVAIAVSGIAGPDGGSATKPVGTVCFAWVFGDACRTATTRFSGDRASVRRGSVIHALEALLAS
jgi:nicotinamide-nucleotide amidase